MNQQFDLKNITDAVLKAINNTDNELSAEEIANRVTEILKKNNVIDPSIKEAAKPTTSNTMENSSEILEEPKPLSGSFTLSEPPKPVETFDTREIDVPLNGSFGIKHKSFDDTVNHSDTASEISNNSSENITDNVENNTEISEEPKPLSGSFTLSEPPKPVETVDTREIDVPLNGSFGIKHKSFDDTVNHSDTASEISNNSSENITDNVENNTEIEDKPKPLSGSFSLSEPPKPVETVDTREINVPLNGSFGIKHKSFDDTVNHSDTASEISNNSLENITDTTDNLENNTEIEDKPKPLSGSFSLSEPPKPVETVDTREIDVPLNGSFGITDDNVNNTTKIVDQPVINNLDIDVSNTVEQSINTISDTIKQDINNTEEVKPLDDSFTLSEKSNPIEDIASKEINVPLSDNFGLDKSDKAVNTNQSSSIENLIKEAELSVSKKESEPLIINNSPESIEDLIKQAELSVNDNNTDIDNNSEEYIEPDYNSSDEPVEDEIEQFEDTTINDDFIIESIKNSEDFKNAVEKVIKDYLSSDEFTEKLKNILNALNN